MSQPGLISSPRSTPITNYSIRDKSKLLQLAEKIEVKKKNLQNNNKPTAAAAAEELVRAVEIVSNGIKSAQVTSQRNLMSRKSKIYASFTRKKTPALKSDPAKTNIEHLVRNRGVSSPSPTPTGFTPVPQIQTNSNGRPTHANGNRAIRPTRLFQTPTRQCVNGTINVSDVTHEHSITRSPPEHQNSIEFQFEPNQCSGWNSPEDVIIVEDLSQCQNTPSGGLWVHSLHPAAPSTVTCNNIILNDDSSKASSLSSSDYDRIQDFTVSVGGKTTVPINNIRRYDAKLKAPPPSLRFSSNFYSESDDSTDCGPTIPKSNITHTKVEVHNNYAFGGIKNSPPKILKRVTGPKIPPRSNSIPTNSPHPKISSAQIIPLSKGPAAAASQPQLPAQFSNESSNSVAMTCANANANLCSKSGPTDGKNPTIFTGEENSSSNDGNISRSLSTESALDGGTTESKETDCWFEKRHSLPSKWNGHLTTPKSFQNPEETYSCRPSNLAKTQSTIPSQRELSTKRLGSRPKPIDAENRKAWKKFSNDDGDLALGRGDGRLTKVKSTSRLNIDDEPPGPLAAKPSLFQRFSKTFSLRFGTGKGRDSKEIGIGSSPDLTRLNRHSTELRTSRSDKCQSGDSGIHLMDNTAATAPKVGQDSSFKNPRIPRLLNDKLSLVEFPNDIWESGSSSASANCEKTDDGFVSDEESSRASSTSIKNYRSLPMKAARQRKADHGMESIRAKVIREIVTTEQSYVKTLNDIIQGYLIPCRRESNLFSPVIISSIFGNIEELLKFHVKFLDSLLDSVRHDDYEQSNIGHVFSLWVEQFELYSDYCLTYPMSMATIKQLSTNPIYEKFFEACRRLQLMDKLPLHGFLLRPIQRICQYHLQLSELVKRTGETHPDYTAVVSALKFMKTVATKINDTQREFDNLQEIIRLQNSIEGWEGQDLVDNNAVILHKGDLVKMAEGEKHREVHVVLLNSEIVVCKKDSVKKGSLSFHLRIELGSTVWLNIDSNEEDDYFGMVHNSWRMYNPLKCTWVLFTCASPFEKRYWIDSLLQSKPHSFDNRMIEMAKLTSMLCSETQATGGIAAVRNKKSRKSLKLNSDDMLIEVSKLKTTSKFYV